MVICGILPKEAVENDKTQVQKVHSTFNKQQQHTCRWWSKRKKNQTQRLHKAGFMAQSLNLCLLVTWTEQGMFLHPE